MKLHPNKRRAMTLVEVIMYVVISVAVFFMSYQTVGIGSRRVSVMRFQAQDLSTALHAGERWRSDIRSVIAAPRLLTRDLRAGRKAHVLELVTVDGLVSYGYDGQRLLRRVGNGQPQELIHGQIESSRMIRDQRGRVTAWRWELELKRRNPRSQMRPLLTFLAVPAAP